MAEKTPTVEDENRAAPNEGVEAPSRDETAELRHENEELRTRLKYLQAEFENYRKRADRDMETVLKFAHEVLLARLLPVLDEMNAAVAGLDGRAGDGIRMVRDNLVKTLGEAGLQEIPAQGLAFDPYVMDAVEQVRDESSKEGIVKDVVRKGYRYGDRILRPAQVIVVKNRGETNG